MQQEGRERPQHLVVVAAVRPLDLDRRVVQAREPVRERAEVDLAAQRHAQEVVPARHRLVQVEHLARVVQEDVPNVDGEAPTGAGEVAQVDDGGCKRGQGVS